MKKRTLVAASMVIGSAFAAIPAAYADVIGFTGAYAPGQWTESLNGTPPGGGAPVASANDGSTLTLTGGDSGCVDAPDPGSGLEGSCSITYTIGGQLPFHHFRFHWEYTSNDEDGPNFDHFGFIVDGLFTQLSANGSPAVQSGDELVSVNDGSTFGWYINCTDCGFGNAVVNITDFSAAPEPGSLALLGVGLAGLAGLRRRRLA